MPKIKVKVVKKDGMPDFYAQGEYHADLTKATVETTPLFAEHLVAMGYAEYLAKDKKALAEAAEVPEDAPVFVERETPELASLVAPAQPEAPAVPTEEITIGAEDAPKKRGKK